MFMIYNEVVHQVVVFASNFHIILYYTNAVILWRLELDAWALVLDSWRLGACSLWPLIVIRGPKRSQLLLMILSSAAMVSNWPGAAWLTSIVNFFISPLLLALALASLNTLSRFISTRTGEWFHKFIAPGNHQTRARLYPIISGTGCQAWSLQLVAFFFLFFLGQARIYISRMSLNLTPDPWTLAWINLKCTHRQPRISAQVYSVKYSQTKPAISKNT